jgi:lysozyme family protein
MRERAMAASNYELSLARLLAHEGGYTNHPSDPGGPTNFGITIHDYRRYIDKGGTASDVRNMQLADAAKIYRTRYWDALRCGELPTGLDYAVFDYGVNSGTGRAAKVLSQLTGQGAGSAMTDAAIAAARAASPQALIARLCDERLAFLKSLKTWPVFGAGWGRRVAEVRRDALAMANGALTQSPGAQPSAGKGRVPEPKLARAGSAAASVAAGAGAAQMSQASGGSLSLTLALAASGIVLAVASWLGWNLWRNRKQETPTSIASEVAP